jgi:hypothetical protein
MISFSIEENVRQIIVGHHAIRMQLRNRLVDVDRMARGALRAREVVRPDHDVRHLREDLADLGILGTLDHPRQRQRLVQISERLRSVAAQLLQPTQIDEQLRVRDRALLLRLASHALRLREVSIRFVVPTGLAQRNRELREHRSEVGRTLGNRLLRTQRILQVDDGTIGLTHAPVRAPDRFEQRGTDLRLLIEVALDVPRRLVEQHAGRWLVPEVGERIGGAEHVQHEVRDFLGALAIVHRLIERCREVLALDRHHDRHGDRKDHDARARDHRGRVPAHEALCVVGPVALPRLHRLVRKVMPDVRDQSLDRAIAMLRLLAQRPHDDRVEIAHEPPRQALRREAALARGLLDVGRILSRQALHRAQDRGAGTRRIHHAYRALHLDVARGLGQLVGTQASQQSIQDDAEGIHVARRRHRRAGDLLGARVFRREHAIVHPRQLGHAAEVRRAEELGDAEIEQLRHALRRHEDVRGFEVAVDDQVLVRVLDRPADVDEQLEARPQVQPLIVAVTIQRRALHVLHDQIRLRIFGFARVDQPGDVRMVEAGEDLALGAEAQAEIDGRGAVDDLDGGLGRELVIGPLAQEDGARATPAQHGDELVVRDDPSDEGDLRGPLMHEQAERTAQGPGQRSPDFQRCHRQGGSSDRLIPGVWTPLDGLQARLGTSQPPLWASGAIQPEK